MRNLLDSLTVNEEKEQLDELLGAKTLKKAALKMAGSAGKRKLERMQKVEDLSAQLLATFKKFIAGQIRHRDYAGVRQDPNDPETLKKFLVLLGFDDSDVAVVVREDVSGDVQDTLLREFLGAVPSKIKKILKKAAEHAVDNNIPVGSGSGNSGRSGSDGSGSGSPSPSPGGVGLESIDRSMATLIKQISPKAAEQLEVDLMDGMQITAAQMKAAVERNVNNGLALLALIGYSYLVKKTSVTRRAPAPGSSEPDDDGVNIT